MVNFKGATVYVPCDAPGCNARSYVTTTLDTGKALDWCGHHATAYEEALLPYVVHTDDRRADLLKRAHVDA